MSFLFLAAAFVAGKLGYRLALRDDHVSLVHTIRAENAALRQTLTTDAKQTLADVQQQVQHVQSAATEVLDCISHIPNLPHWSTKSPLVSILNSKRLKTGAEAAAYEATVDCDEIWISTRDLAKDLASVKRETEDGNDATFEHAVEHNIRDRGTLYIYLVPDSPANRHYATHDLAAKFADVANLLDIVFLPPGDRLRMPYSDGDFAIYVGGDPPGVTAHFEFPWSSRQLWIETPPSMAREWAGRVAQIRDDVLGRERQ